MSTNGTTYSVGYEWKSGCSQRAALITGGVC